ncbi:MAG TPA: hypothetical protein VM076_09595 [Gemmatimonadaceae bacterium]|nr:hypothetical protein [Gemmatimonadaceae bacterium]
MAALLLLGIAGACASGRGSSSSIGVNQPSVNVASPVNTVAAAATLACAECGAIPMPAEITRAVESRISDLKTRGGDCSRYGSVLESSYRSGRITLRPFMWRVGSHLASGEAKPNGDMTLAREIDSLNVGVRTVDDVLFSMEHEAVHITFDLASGIDASEVKANQYVQGCKG